MLTPRQKQILNYLTKYVNDNDYFPSYEEIKRHFKLSSVATIHEHIEALKSKGYLDRKRNQPRGIKLLNKRSATMASIPLAGAIAAGEPIEAFEDVETIDIPKNMLSKSGKHFALKVKGSSMVEDGIMDGSTVIIKKQHDAENGDTIVALINGNEATLKKIYKEKKGYRLQPANSALKPIFVKNLRIQGKVISIIRNFEEEKETKKMPLVDKIACGDVIEMMKKIDDNSVHLAITSPPYNVGKAYDNHFDKMNYQEYL